MTTHAPRVVTALPASGYIPPTSQAGSPLNPGRELCIAPGVRGYAIRVGDTVYIPLIIAKREGSGDVGRFLDSLAPCSVVPNVTRARLRGMLARRGWQLMRDPECDRYVHPHAVTGKWRDV